MTVASNRHVGASTATEDARVKIFYSDHFVIPLPAGHRFPIRKYSLLRERLLESGFVGAEALEVPGRATDDELELVHTHRYVRAVVDGTLDAGEVRRLGLPWSVELVERSRRSVGGTIGAARAATVAGYAANLAGGTHHAFADRGEGFCVFNDVAVAARVLQQEGRVARVVVIDTDVHQGNGTAAIFAHDSSVFTFSLHGGRNFPFHKEASDLDIELPDACGDGLFLDAVRTGCTAALERSGADLAFYIAGADAFEGDTLGRLSVSAAALAVRDSMVYDLCERAGVPVAIVMGGGYARPITDSVEIQYRSVAEAARRCALRTRAGVEYESEEIVPGDVRRV